MNDVLLNILNILELYKVHLTKQINFVVALHIQVYGAGRFLT